MFLCCSHSYISLFTFQYLINSHNFDYPYSRLSGLFAEVPIRPDNRGLTVKTFMPVMGKQGKRAKILLFTLDILIHHNSSWARTSYPGSFHWRHHYVSEMSLGMRLLELKLQELKTRTFRPFGLHQLKSTND